jgi:hypothetical protein
MSHQMVGIMDVLVGTDTRLWFWNRELVGDRVHRARAGLLSSNSIAVRRPRKHRAYIPWA